MNKHDFSTRENPVLVTPEEYYESWDDFKPQILGRAHFAIAKQGVTPTNKVGIDTDPYFQDDARAITKLDEADKEPKETKAFDLYTQFRTLLNFLFGI